MSMAVICAAARVGLTIRVWGSILHVLLPSTARYYDYEFDHISLPLPLSPFLVPFRELYSVGTP